MKPKLTLRDLFWLVLVCGLALGWWLDRSRLGVDWHRYQQLKEELAFLQLLMADEGYTRDEEGYKYKPPTHQMFRERGFQRDLRSFHPYTNEPY